MQHLLFHFNFSNPLILYYNFNSTDTVILQRDLCGHPRASLAWALCPPCRKGKSISPKTSPDFTTVYKFYDQPGAR